MSTSSSEATTTSSATASTTTSTTGGQSTPGTILTEARRLAPATGTFSTCPDCHALLDPPRADRPALTDAFRHERHLTRGAACDSCHARPIHSESGTRRPTMAICYSCHGEAPASVAPADCVLCHPADFPLKPTSHGDAFYQEGHSRVVEQQGTDDCFLCHQGGTEGFCRACHGLDIPHPEGWTGGAGGGPGAHTTAAQEDATICVRCHQNRGAAPEGCYGGECHGS
ncbi:MAG: cytochrome c3 family protein [Thermoleophilia bacterium]